MSTAFQPSAFQSDAFQIEGGVATNDVTANIAFTLDGCSAAITVDSAAALFDYHDGGSEKKRRKREQEQIEEQRLKRERLRSQIENIVSPPEPVNLKLAQEVLAKVFKETPKPVILPALPEYDEEEEIAHMIVQSYEIPKELKAQILKLLTKA